jgi:hypothetical protein
VPDRSQDVRAEVLARLSGHEMVGYELRRDTAGEPCLARSAEAKVGKNPPPTELAAKA